MQDAGKSVTLRSAGASPRIDMEILCAQCASMRSEHFAGTG